MEPQQGLELKQVLQNLQVASTCHMSWAFWRTAFLHSGMGGAVLQLDPRTPAARRSPGLLSLYMLPKSKQRIPLSKLEPEAQARVMQMWGKWCQVVRVGQVQGSGSAK